jgi:hypothetical protein
MIEIEGYRHCNLEDFSRSSQLVKAAILVFTSRIPGIDERRSIKKVDNNVVFPLEVLVSETGSRFYFLANDCLRGYSGKCYGHFIYVDQCLGEHDGLVVRSTYCDEARPQTCEEVRTTMNKMIDTYQKNMKDVKSMDFVDDYCLYGREVMGRLLPELITR